MEAPSKPQDGTEWLDTSAEPSVLRQYRSADGGWVKIDMTIAKLRAHAAQTGSMHAFWDLIASAEAYLKSGVYWPYASAEELQAALKRTADRLDAPDLPRGQKIGD